MDTIFGGGVNSVEMNGVKTPGLVIKDDSHAIAGFRSLRAKRIDAIPLHWGIFWRRRNKGFTFTLSNWVKQESGS